MNVLNTKYSEYNLNIISLNWLITEFIEPIILDYCISINYAIDAKSRDTKKLFFHFVAENILQTLCKFDNIQNILFFVKLKKLTVLPDDCLELLNSVILQFLAKFRLCTYFAESYKEVLDLEDIYKIKLISDNCSIKSSNLQKIKKFLLKNNYTQLLKTVGTSCNTQRLLIS